MIPLAFNFLKAFSYPSMAPLAATHPYALEDHRFFRDWRSDVYPLGNLMIMIPDGRPSVYKLGHALVAIPRLIYSLKNFRSTRTCLF